MDKIKKPKLITEEMENLWLMYQNNMYPSMIEVLAEELKPVSVASINRLGVGYDYIEQCWVFVERDERGQIVGLSRRYRDGSKCMVPGSGRGLIYECLEVQSKGKSYPNSGFISVKTAGVECPVCGKPNWCMISSDNVNDPSAVICPRTPEGAVKHIKNSGYLHQMHTTKQRQGSVLPDSDKRYVVVEGGSDVLATMDLGYVGVGRPSAECGMSLVAALLKGKPVVVMGENDAGVGIRGMDKAFTQCKAGCQDLLKCLPPVKHKDMRHWLASGLTSEEFEAWVKQNGTDYDLTRLLNEPPKNFSALANRFATEMRYTPEGNKRLVYHQNNWYAYKDGKYEATDPEFIEAELRSYYDSFEYKGADIKQTVKSVQVSSKLQAELKRALRDCLNTKVPNNIAEPCILSTGKPFDASHVVMFKNGMLDVTSGKLVPHNNDIFTTATLPYNYDPNAGCELWLKCVGEWLDEEQAALLQEWFGYNLIMSNHLEQMIFICGVSGSGKSTAVETLQHILGGDDSENFSAVDTGQLTKDIHGTAALVGKYAMFLDEVDKMDHKQKVTVLALIKRITGNDIVPIRRMYKIAMTGKLFCRVTFTSNSLVVFPDETQSIFRRYNLLKFSNDFGADGVINKHLKRELKAERQGIAVWAVEGLRRLLKNNGNLTVPTVSASEIEEIKAESSPLKTMLEEYFAYGDVEAFTSRKQVYDLYIKVCEAQGIVEKYRNKYIKLLRLCKEARPELAQLKHRQGNVWGWKQMKLTKEAIDLLGG